MHICFNCVRFCVLIINEFPMAKNLEMNIVLAKMNPIFSIY